ncbi:MAG: type II secretion system protein [Candidatus Nitronauta litoralis]|uniref:Type II secretion system protein n=1 Tax=Candidatus Nitronauta litoralis TaxID=2705533 RepID=A0A7T0G1J8_9BACT|nr:MAG: type II secretion system protein [Candidatus Nitronauta litoralis]
MATHRLKNESGFTLLELILSLAIVAVIGALSVVSVRLAVSSQKAGGDKAEQYQRLRFIGEQLTEKIHSAHPFFLMGTDAPLFSRLNTDKIKGKRILAFDGEPDQVKFITTAGRLNDIDARTTEFHEVRFFKGKNPKTGETGVILVEKPLSFDTALQDTPESLEEATFITLAQNVDKLEFRYLKVKATKAASDQPGQKSVKYISEWVDTIKTEPIEFSGKSQQSLFKAQEGAEGRMSLPRAIEVSLKLENDSEDEEDEDESKALPKVVIPTHTGLVYERNLVPQAEQEG